MTHPYLSGKHWWLGVSAIALFTLLLFHSLTDHKPPRQPTPGTAQAISAMPVPAKAPLPTHPVLDLFNPSAENLSRDQAISRTRGEIEQLLVIAILLQRCNHITNEHYQSIYHAGERYTKRSELFSDNDALMRELLASAEKTYRLVYAQTDCAETSLQTLKTQTLEWQAQYANQ
jgi:hypothetical protein